MSIETIAPEMFDFQDSVCVEIMLRFFSFTRARFIVEPKDGEDAELEFTQAETVHRVAIQIKGSSSEVTLATIASCMAHTPSHSEKDTLLERMIADQTLWVFLVMKGRCDDASSIYVSTDWNGIPHSLDKLSKIHSRALLEAFSKAKVPGAKSSKLREKRQKHIEEFTKHADITLVRKALCRLIVIERVDDAALESICAERLRRDHNVPSDRIGDVLRRLRSVVKRAKKDRLDTFPLFRETLASAAPQTVRPNGYIPREMECTWDTELSSSGVLLLSGLPRVGKSYTARWVGAEFQSRGYEVLQSGDISQVERFLEDSIEALRLAILDDPLGSASAIDSSARVLDRIEKLISRLPLQRKLIVAQGEAQLLATARAPSLSEVNTAGKSWHDLGNCHALFLLKVWESVVATYHVPCRFSGFIYKALSSNSLKFEPGCLEHLAVNHHRLKGDLCPANINRLAREESIGFGRQLAEAGYEEILSVLAITTVAQGGVGVRELAFAMGSGGSTLPGKPDRFGFDVSNGNPPVNEPQGPTYEEVPQLSQRQIDHLDNLERHRVVEWDSAGHVGFSHPFYRSAAESLVCGLTEAISNRIITAVLRGLFCLSPLTSQATAKNIAWVFDRLSNRENARSALVDYAVHGLKSYFPVTRDLCFRFLVERLEDLPANRQSEAPQWISEVTYINLDNIVWNNGQASLPFNQMLNGGSIGHHFARVKRSEVDTELRLLKSTDGHYVGPERTARVLKYIRNNLDELNVPAMGRLLSYDAAALRAEAIKHWLSKTRDEDDVVLARIFGDEHPSCAVEALRGSITGWSEYSELRRTQVLEGMRGLAKNKLCAAAMLNLLVLFDRVEITGEKPPWVIFEVLFPIVMRVLPHNAAIVDARLFNVVRISMKKLPATSMVDICDGWIDWLERNEAEDRLPSEFSLGVGKVLLSSTSREPRLRENMIGRMLAFQGTGAIVAFVADIVDGWDTLLEEERKAVLKRLKLGRSDDVWLQAVAITRSAVPRVVQRVVLGDQVSLSEGAEVLMNKVPAALLNAAIHVYSGRPQPLWWLGTHHGAKAVWEPVMDLVARKPHHSLFELGWDHIYFHGDGARLSRIIESVGVEEADRMLDILIRLKVGWTGNYMPEAWATVLAMAKDEGMRASWLDRIVPFISAILDDLSDLRFWLSEEKDQIEMLGRLKSDVTIFRITNIGTRKFNPAEAREHESSYIKLLEMLLEENPPQLLDTCDRLVKWLEADDSPKNELVEAVRRQRESIFNERKRIKDNFDERDYPLCGWISP